MSREEERTEDRKPAEDRKPPDHPRLSDREDAEQRGEDPPDSVGAPRPKVDDDEDSGWEPDPHAADPWKDYIAEVGGEHRPHREDVLPYLLIRAFAPGDRAGRPIWPPRPSWLSPDIHLIDDMWTGPFRPDKVVGSPSAGRSYRVFVQVWNLGLVQAVGVHLRAWHVAPGFFGGQPGAYTPQSIGGAFFDLQPRTASGAHRVVEVIPAWSIPPHLTGHECLLASVECPADRWDGALDANADRHVGQRNLTILGPAASLAPLLKLLGEALGNGELLEVTLDADEAKGATRYGVPFAGGQHLFVAGTWDERLLILPTRRLANLLGERLPDLSEPGVAAALFSESWRQFEGQVSTDGLDRALGRLLDTDELIAEDILQALGGEGARTIQLAAFDESRRVVGGYSVRLDPNIQA